MSRSKVSSPQHSVRKTTLSGDKKVRFLGLSLSGGKADKACLTVLDYYSEHRKIFLSKLFEKIKNEETISADTKIIDSIFQSSSDVAFLGFDVPWQLPLCLRHTFDCSGVESCDQCPVKWQREFLKSLKKKKNKTCTPYTQRSVEIYLNNMLEESFELGHAMGANTAPLLARAQFLKRRINVPLIEVNPKISIWRIGRSLLMPKSHLRFHRHSVGGDDARRSFLDFLSEKAGVFIYEQDRKIMIENNHAFESFIVALTGYLKFRGQTEQRPQDFPSLEDWIEFPVKKIAWDGAK